MKKELTKILFIGLMILAVTPSHAQTRSQIPSVNVAVIADGPSERVSALRNLFLSEMRTVNLGEFDIQAPSQLQLSADRTLAGVRTILNKVLSDPRTDVVVTLGVLSSHAAAQRSKLPKPVVAPLVSNRKFQNLPYKDGTSGKHNLSYVSLDVDIRRDLVAFREISSFERLAFLLDSAINEAIPGIDLEVKRVADELGIRVIPVGVSDSATTALVAIPETIQAVYVGPAPGLTANEYQRLVTGLINRKLPSFAFEGKSDVLRGLLVGIAPAVEMNRLARRVALNVRRILLGEDAATLPVAFARAEGLTLNMRTARAIGFSPSWQFMTRAELLYDEPDATRTPLTLAEAVQESLDLNLNIKVAEANTSAGQENIHQARAALLPQIKLSASGVVIDEDVATSTPGRAERTTSGSLTLEQILYSEPARANLDIQKQLQAVRLSEQDQLRLDITLETTQAYLAILGAKTNVRVQKDNLRLSRSNLDLARARRRIGTAGPSEVYRWESEIANARRVLIEAQTQARVAEIALNALLHRPLEEVVATVEVGLDEPTLIAGNPRLYELIDNPASFRLLRDFLVQETFAAVPELQQLDARINAQARALESAKHAYWQPTVSLRADRTETFERNGSQGDPIPNVNDTETTIALQLSLPLYTSGSRSAKKAKAYEELKGLRMQQQAVAEQIELRVRSALHITRSAYTSIRLSRQAADAAESNFTVVRDAYSRGKVSILDLLDAQNAALVADLRAATATYHFLRSLMEVERATARFDFFLTPQDQASWFARVERYFKEQNVPSSPDRRTVQ